MREVLICVGCQQIYKKHRIKFYGNDYYCPNIKDSCDCQLIPVDENLADIVLKFLTIGLSTLFSCEGHPYSVNPPYLVFGESAEYKNDILPIEKIRDLCIKVKINDSSDYLCVIEEIKFQNRILPFSYEAVPCKILTLRARSIKEYSKICGVEKLEVKIDFINFLYSLFDEVKNMVTTNSSI